MLTFGQKYFSVKFFTIFIPMIIFVFLLMGNIHSWRTARKLSFQLTRNQSASVAEELALRMDLLLQKSSRGLALLSNLWREAPVTNKRETFLKWANGLVETDPTFDMILYLDSDNVMMVTPPSSSTPLVGLDIQSRPAKEDLFKTLRKSIAPLDAPPTARLTSKGGFVLWFPVLIELRGTSSMAGTIAGALNLKKLLGKAVTPSVDKAFLIRTVVDGQTVLTPSDDLPEKDDATYDLTGQSWVNIMGMDFSVTVWPRGGGAYKQLAASDLMRLTIMVVLSMLASSLLGVSLYALDRVKRNQMHRQKAVQALAQSEQRFRAIFQQAGVGIIQCGLDDKIQHANDTLCKILGYTPQELIGLRYQACGFPEDQTETMARMQKMLDDKTYSGLFNKRLRHKTGRPIWVRMTTSLIHSEEGDYQYSIDVIEDITKQHKLELQLRQAQKMESIGILAGGIAHDFNNILGSILGFTQMTLLDSSLETKSRKRLEQVYKAATLAKDLVRQILTFSRRSDDTPRAILISPIIKETLKFLKALLPANVDIRQDITGTTGTVMADPTQVHQVLMNLCTNAAHAMTPQGGILTVQLYRQKITSEDILELDLAIGEYMVIGITDTGIGIDPCFIDRIFEPYYTSKEIGEGTGMGLAVVHGIVKEYQGKIQVESTPGAGSAFTVYLPEVSMEEQTGPERIQQIPRGKGTLLLIDDNETLLAVGQEMLEYLGYRVETFSDPLKALKRIQKNPKKFQGVITDLTMPKMNGIELAGKILSLDHNIPVILCTGNSKNINFDEIRRSGIHSLLVKPLIIEELAPSVKAALKS